MEKENNGFLYPMGIADAYGMGWEFVANYEEAEGPNDLSKFYHHPKFKDYKPGHYTDDTQMAAVNGELLLQYQDNLDDLTTEIFADAYVARFKKDPRLGYSKYMYATLSDPKVQTGKDFMSRLDATKGVTSGAAMRAAPFGLIPDINLAMSLAKRQAQVTHNTQEGILSAQMVAAKTHFLHYKLIKMPDNGPNLVTVFDLRTNERLANPHSGIGIISDAFTCSKKEKTFSELVKNVINLGAEDGIKKDTDTIAAIAVSMASRSVEFVQNIPEALENTFENGEYGADYLKDLDNRLLTAFPKPA